MSDPLTDPLLATSEPSRPPSMLDEQTDAISGLEDASGARRTTPLPGGSGQGGVVVFGERVLQGEIQQRYNLLKQKVRGIERNLTILKSQRLRKSTRLYKVFLLHKDPSSLPESNGLTASLRRGCMEKFSPSLRRVWMRK